MKTLVAVAIVLLTIGMASGENPRTRNPRYAWKDSYSEADSLARRISPPAGFGRVKVEPGSFGEWLRGVPLKSGNPAVLLYDGRKKANQNAHAAVVDLDVGNRDLQQCADAVIRLRAEYLFGAGRSGEIRFGLTNGQKAVFSDWAAGQRPVVKRDKVTWNRSGQADGSHASLRRYLDFVFAYAGTLSLSRELKGADGRSGIEPGDVFIQGGSPGHAVIVLDVAVQAGSGRRVFLLAQSYMPAQEIHVLKNPGNGALSPWYDEGFGETLVTPEWVFKRTDRKRS